MFSIPGSPLDCGRFQPWVGRKQTQDLATYYPTTTLVTGFDIIFFWVARMTMMAGHFTGQMPFQNVYIHGLVLDENGKKMSKSANNGIDPLLLIDKYGTDSLRYTLIREVAGAGQDIRLEYDRTTQESASVQASRNFGNKLWNAARFVMMNLDGKTPQMLGNPALQGNLELGDRKASASLQASRWILSRFQQVVRQTSDYLDTFGLGEAAKGLYDFIWGDFCDWYIELVKSQLREDATSESRQIAQATLAYVLEGILKLLHPFMPHITEEIWHTLTQTTEDSLAVQPYPEINSQLIDPELEQQFDLLIGTIRTIRNLRAEADVKPGVKVSVILQSGSDKERQILEAGQSYIQDLAKVETLTITPELSGELKRTMAGVVGTIQVLMPLAGVVDIDALSAKLKKDLAKVEAEIKALSGRLANQNFVNKAPAEVVQGAKEALAEAEKQAEILRSRLNQIATES
jgi:valyl-tRNA synthetase